MKRLALIALLGLAPLVACVVPQQQTAASYNNAGAYGQQSATGEVVINGVAMSAEDAAAARIPAGRYWYDARSGLWGLEGGPTQGITQAGLNVGGQLSAEASNGHTGVYVNGRNLPVQDVAALQRLVPTQVMPGRYVLDASGNMGYEGGQPVVNLLALAKAQQSQGGGDNFWSRGIINAAGNESNGAGYVCVSGSCATYGMQTRASVYSTNDSSLNLLDASCSTRTLARAAPGRIRDKLAALPASVITQ